MRRPEDLIDEAEAEAREADALAKAMAERVRDGDDSVTAEDLANAEGLGKFARLRVEAARKKAAKLRKDTALASAEAFVQELHGLLEEDAELVQAWLEAVHGLRRLADVQRHRSQVVQDFALKRSEFDDLLRRDAGTDMATEFGVLPAEFGGDVGFQIPADGVNVADVAASRLLASVAHQALDPNDRYNISAAINSYEPELENSTLAARVTGWADAVRDDKAGTR